jgi:23S rRNA (pseudouridine1915-N3)-methyltransferase
VKILVVAVGRARPGPERALWEEFSDRLDWPIRLVEVESKKPGPGLKDREAELLLKSVPDDALLVALDESGKALSSPDFAKQLGRWQDQGVGTLAFAIGGADGLADAVRAEARLTLSLGPMTWPHMLVRGLLAEQLYRAERILQGHPYHRV